MELLSRVPDALSMKGILKAGKTLALPILLAMGCVREGTDPVAHWIDHDAEHFDIKVNGENKVSSADEVTDIPYSLLALMQGGDEIDTEGHKNFELPIRIDPNVSEEEQYDLDEQAFAVLYVNKTTWCTDALDWLSIYKIYFLMEDGCIHDETTCGDQICDEESLWGKYEEATVPEEETEEETGE